jgi:hypothetical protein
MIVCKNCGYDEGLHHFETLQCPKGGEAPLGRKQEYLSTTYDVERLSIFLARQIAWSKRTFGPGRRTLGILKHIEKEIAEAKANPEDLTEWIDIIILAIDGYWRHGGTPETIMPDLTAKAETNYRRTYPMPTSEDEPSEHIRDAQPTTPLQEGQSASPKEKHCGRPHPHLRQSCLPGIWQCDDCRAASATPLQEARDRGGAMSDHSANPDRENPCGNCFNQGQDCEANPERDCTGWERDIPRRFLHVNIGDWVAYRCYSVGQEAFPWIIVRWDDDHIVNGEWIEAVKVIETRAEAEARAALAAEGKA